MVVWNSKAKPAIYFCVSDTGWSSAAVFIHERVLLCLSVQMVDPTISIGHNVQTLLLNDNSLPRPQVGAERENEATRVAQIAMFDNQVCNTQQCVSCNPLVCEH